MSITFQEDFISIIADNGSPEPVRVEVYGVEAVGTGLGYHDSSRIRGIYTDKKHEDFAPIHFDAYIVTHLPSGYGFPAPIPGEEQARALITEMVQLGLDWTQEKADLERDPLFKQAGKIFRNFLMRNGNEEDD
jgi:hypothetical protein